jgi:hypothetical protein
MKFILTFTLPPATRDAAFARFLETGGQPPPGVRLLGRWTRLDLCGGVVLLESDDPQALTAFAHGWGATWWSSRGLRSWRIRRSRMCSSGPGSSPVAPSGGEGLPQAAAIGAEQELPDGTTPEAEQSGEAIPVPPAVPGGLEGEGEEPGQARDPR